MWVGVGGEGLRARVRVCLSPNFEHIVQKQDNLLK